MGYGGNVLEAFKTIHIAFLMGHTCDYDVDDGLKDISVE